MENASKALLIAGAVLIVILIISVGIMIFSSSKGLFGSATTSMTEQEQKLFNDKFIMYEGKRVSGTQVRELLRTVITNNANSDNPQVTINGSKIGANASTTTLPGGGSNKDTEILTTNIYTVTCARDNTGVVNNIAIDKVK